MPKKDSSPNRDRKNDFDLLAVARWTALSRLPKHSPSVLMKLFRHFGASEEIFTATAKQLKDSGLDAGQIRTAKDEIDDIIAALRNFTSQDMKPISIESAAYPQDLFSLRTPPMVTYLSGKILPKDKRAIAIVGTRTPSMEGRRVARELAHQSASRGFCVVSGLARGIDTEAHRSALRATGRTIAVLGNGLQNIYPAENKSLAARIARHGALLSEVWPTQRVSRHALLARDRLQAALSRAVVVIQTHTGCGSITTARYAIACRRPLFAIRWEEEPFTIGLARLREMGARIITEHEFDEVFRIAESGDSQAVLSYEKGQS